MKTNLFVTLAVLFYFGCAKSQPPPMTPQEQQSVRTEITEALNGIIQGLEKMDAEVLFQSYSNSPDFILFTTDGSMVDYQAAKNHHVEWFKSLSSLKVKTVADQFKLLPGKSVVCVWHAKFDMTLKTGGGAQIDFAITLIFNKIDNRWMVVYQQTSALPPAQEKPNK
jgi:hypothetical protein